MSKEEVEVIGAPIIGELTIGEPVLPANASCRLVNGIIQLAFVDDNGIMQETMETKKREWKTLALNRRLGIMPKV